MMVTPDIQRVTDLKGKKIGVSFGGSTFAGTKALLELYKMNPEKDVQYVSIPGSQPKIAAMQQGIIQAALLAPPADYVALKAGFKRLANLADLFKDTSFSGLAATGKTIKRIHSSPNAWCALSSAAFFMRATIPKTRFKP